MNSVGTSLRRLVIRILQMPGTAVLPAGNNVAARAVLVIGVLGSPENAARDLPS